MSKLLSLTLIAIALVMAACSKFKGETGSTGAKGKDGAIIVLQPTPTPKTQIEEMVQSDNDYREITGLAPLTKGLVCTLYTVPNTTTALSSAVLTTVSSYLYRGDFNQPDSASSLGLNILPPALKSIYKDWIVVRCIGKFVAPESDYYFFDLSTDDGSMLYIAGATVINNDGMHGIITKSGFKFLRMGVYDFRLDFLQGAGSQALILKMDSSTVLNTNLYH
jgi:hypothetical protein